MSETANLRDRVHHQLLHRLVAANPGATTDDIQRLYEGVAPLVYHGTESEPVKRRWRRKVLGDLLDEGAIKAHESSRGRVWIPLSAPETSGCVSATDVPRAACGGRESGKCVGRRTTGGAGQ